MSKLAAYLGPPINIATIVEAGSHALVRQAADHPDGFGLGWFPADEQPEPLTLSSRLPLWREDQILRIARRYTSRCIVAGLRKLGAEEPFDSAGCQPFQHGPWLFHHDGELTRFRDVFDRPLRN